MTNKKFNGSHYSAENQLSHYLGDDVNLNAKTLALIQTLTLNPKPNLPYIPNTKECRCLRNGCVGSLHKTGAKQMMQMLQLLNVEILLCFFQFRH